MTKPDIDRLITERINASLIEGKLPCPIAFKAARDLEVSLGAVGGKADELGIRIIDCQLGCFGSKKATHEELKDMQISPPVAEAIQASLVNGKIPCATAHELARKLKIGRRKVGDTASKLNIRVSDCQLGCF